MILVDTESLAFGTKRGSQCDVDLHLRPYSKSSLILTLKVVSYLIMWLLTLQLFKNSIDTQEKLRLNLHSLSVSMSMSELLEYGR